jgi:hypothetical protein
MEDRIPYEQAREKIKSGDVVFVCNKGLFHHKLITWFTRSEHIHVGIAFWTNIEGHEHLMITEANGGAQRRIVNLSHYKDHQMDILMGPRPWEEIKDAALERLGQVQYNWIQAGYVGVRERFQFALGVNLPDIDMPGEICSERVADIFGIEDNHLSPAALFRHMHWDLNCPIRVKTL